MAPIAADESRVLIEELFIPLDISLSGANSDELWHTFYQFLKTWQKEEDIRLFKINDRKLIELGTKKAFNLIPDSSLNKSIYQYMPSLSEYRIYQIGELPYGFIALSGNVEGTVVKYIAERFSKTIETHNRIEKTHQINMDLSAIMSLAPIVTSSLNQELLFLSVLHTAKQVSRAEASLLFIRENKKWTCFHEDITIPGRLISLPVEEKFMEPLLEGTNLRWKSASLLKEIYEGTDKQPLSVILIPLNLSGNITDAILCGIMSDAAKNDRAAYLLKRISDFILVAFKNLKEFQSEETKVKRIATLFKALATEKEKVDIIAGQAPFGLILMRKDGLLEMVNPAARNILKMTVMEKKEKMLSPHKEHAQFIRAMAQRALESGNIEKAPLDIDAKAMRIQVSPLSKGGNLVLISIEDVTEWVSMNKLKEQLVSAITHELKNPLASILGALDIISRGRAGEIPDNLKPVLGIIKDNSQSLSSILQDVSRLTKLSSYRSSETLLNLSEMIGEILTRFTSIGSLKQLKVKKFISTSSLLSDSWAVEIMIQNLIGNAFKYAPIDGIIGIGVVDEGDKIHLWVADNGPGIPDDEKDFIFEKFYRASNVKSMNIPGTGLGLSIVKGAADFIGSSVEFDSPLPEPIAEILGAHPKTGCAFHIYFKKGEISHE